MIILATVLLGPGSEAIVGDAIRSALPVVDGFIFIESGCGDDAVSVAQFDAHPKQTGTTKFAWNGDYSEARNFALQKAREAGADYALTLDPDERLHLPDTIRATLMAHSTVDVFMAKDMGAGYFKERIIRCAAPVKWHGRVCEYLSGQVQPPAKLAGGFTELPKNEESERRRWERGVVECQRMIDDAEDTFRWHRHRGSCLIGLKRIDEGVAEYKLALERAEHPEDRAWVRYLIAEQLVLAERFEEAKRLAAIGLAEHAGFIQEFGWILAFVEYTVGDDQNASRWAQLVTQTPHDRTRISFRSAKASSGPKDILAVLHGPAKPGCIKVHRMHVARDGWESESVEWMMNNGGYEAAEYQTLKRLLRSSDRVLELGAGVGFLAAYCAERLVHPGRVLTVEADPKMEAPIRATFAANDVSPELLIAAVSGDGRPRRLERAEDFWSTKTSPADVLQSSPSKPGTVDGIALSTLIEAHRPTVLICDIEGGETTLTETVLEGVRAVLIEVHSEEADKAVETWLVGQGFERHNTAPRVRMYERQAAP